MEFGRRVLIVDDDREIRSVLIYALTSYNFTVDLCENGAEALLRTMTKGFDYIITDYNMPEMNGVELVKELRKKMPLLTVIIGMSGEDRSMDFLNAGANDFVQKPFAAYDLAMMMDGGDILS